MLGPHGDWWEGWLVGDAGHVCPSSLVPDTGFALPSPPQPALLELPARLGSPRPHRQPSLIPP